MKSLKLALGFGETIHCEGRFLKFIDDTAHVSLREEDVVRNPTRGLNEILYLFCLVVWGRYEDLYYLGILIFNFNLI